MYSHPWLQREFKASLGYNRPSLKNKTKAILIRPYSPRACQLCGPAWALFLRWFGFPCLTTELTHL